MTKMQTFEVIIKIGIVLKLCLQLRVLAFLYVLRCWKLDTATSWVENAHV